LKKLKRKLGKGLGALFADNSTDSTGGIIILRVSEIEPNKSQPRKNFNEEALLQLSDSISQHGILQPLVVRPIAGTENYQLVAGERRWRAARMAGLSEVPVIIRELTDNEAMEIALIENLQREDLNPIEEAEGYKLLLHLYNMTQDEISKRVGKSRPVITNALRLLSLPDNVIGMVKNGSITQGHARTLLGIENEQLLKNTANEIISKGLTVREVEKLVKQISENNTQYEIEPKKSNKATESMLIGEIERGLTEYLGRKVKIQQGKNRGVIEIEFYSDEDLKLLSLMLSKNI
jgi:ParB family chromosome partitioning protein